MSRGCPPDKRSQRDWDALPTDLRSMIIEVRKIIAALNVTSVTVGGEMNGIWPAITFVRGRRTMTLETSSMTISGLSMAEFVRAGLKHVGVTFD